MGTCFGLNCVCFKCFKSKPDEKRHQIFFIQTYKNLFLNVLNRKDRHFKQLAEQNTSFAMETKQHTESIQMDGHKYLSGTSSFASIPLDHLKTNCSLNNTNKHSEHGEEFDEEFDQFHSPHLYLIGNTEATPVSLITSNNCSNNLIKTNYYLHQINQDLSVDGFEWDLV